MAALLTIEAQNTEKLSLYLGECRAMKVPVLPPDVNTSDMGFRVTSEGVRFGLMAVKNVGGGAIQSILARRSQLKRIESLYALCEDVDLRLVNKRVLESLVKAGACDSVLPTGERSASLARAQLGAMVDKCLEHGNRFQRDRDRGQTQLFEIVSVNSDGTDEIALPEVKPWSRSERLAGEKEALGLYLSGHPIDGYRDQLEAAGARTISSLGTDGEEVLVGGIISGYRPRKTKRGESMAVMTLEDRAGSLEVVVFPKTYERCATILSAERLVVVSGKLRKDEETAKVTADDVRPIECLDTAIGRTLSIHLSSNRHGRETLQALADLLQVHRGPGRVCVQLDLDERTPPLRVQARLTEARVRRSDELAHAIVRLCGENAVSWN